MKDSTAATGVAGRGLIGSPTAHILRLAGMAVILSVLVCVVGVGSGSPASPSHGSLIEFWDGTSWTQQVSPNPNGTGSFSAVTGTSATDAWAVGTFVGDAESALAAHWDGSSWQQVAMPTPAESVFEEHGTPKFDFTGMAAISATDVWAVGWHGRRQFKSQRPLIEHWTGSAWTIMPQPQPGGNSLLGGTAAVSSRTIWAVGSYTATRYRYGQYHTLVLHWNGTAWKYRPSPSPGLRHGDGASLSGVAVTSAKNAWAVGSYAPRIPSSGPLQARTLVLHWNGKKWSRVRSPNPGGDRGLSNRLYGVAAVGRNDVWAVGGNYINGQESQLVEHWNGRSWRTVPAPPGLPQCTSQPLTGLAPLARNDIWAVGDGIDCGKGYPPLEQALAEHWDGKAWSVSPVANPPSSLFDSFYDIAAATPHAVWAVGRY